MRLNVEKEPPVRAQVRSVVRQEVQSPQRPLSCDVRLTSRRSHFLREGLPLVVAFS